MTSKEKLVAIGPREEIVGLRSVGVEAFAAETPSEVEGVLREQVLRREVCLVMLSESVADGARDLVAELRERAATAILLVPSHRGSRGLALEWLKHAMEQAIGVDVISDK